MVLISQLKSSLTYNIRKLHVIASRHHDYSYHMTHIHILYITHLYYQPLFCFWGSVPSRQVGLQPSYHNANVTWHAVKLNSWSCNAILNIKFKIMIQLQVHYTYHCHALIWLIMTAAEFGHNALNFDSYTILWYQMTEFIKILDQIK